MSQRCAVRPLLFEQQEARLAVLERLPRGLWLASTINSQGSLEPRLHALEGLRAALLAGTQPAPSAAQAAHWPDAALAAALYAALLQLGLPAWCRERSELADQVISSLLWHLDLIVDYVDRGNSVEAAIAQTLAAFAEEWRERCGLLEELEAVFGSSGDLLKNTNWDLLRGLLRSEGWAEIMRIRRLIETLPELAKLIRQLGRAQPTPETNESHQHVLQLMEQASAPHSSIRVTRVPEMPGETRGVYRSGRIARMLPSETMLLTHRRLRLVWHARHAERSLLSYEEDERMREPVQQMMPLWRSSPQRQSHARMQAGPMLILVDTSGSMQGGAEAVAKALVLEAMRTAHAQGRPCRAYAFGGPEEILELELGLDASGIEQLARFLGQGFRGGTEICSPLERVLERVAEERWQLADLLIASDGEFGATPETARALARAKAELGLRVQGVLIGDRETLGMLELADDIFWVRDWRRYGTCDADSPVRTKSLTATYFPGALRSPAREAPASGAAAAQALFRRAPSGSA